MKVGLVLEGGASRTVFSCGVMDVLLKNNIIADYVIGTSAGIAYGVSYASGQIGRNRDVSVKFMSDKRYMGMRHLLSPKNRSYYNLDFVFNQIPNKEILFDYDAFEKFGGDVLATVTNIKTGKAEYLPVSAENGDFIALQASCALPILFKPITVDGKQYLDGGLADAIPFEKAFADDCDKVIVILTREKGYIKGKDKAEKLVSLAYRKYPELVTAFKLRPENYNKQILKLAEYEKSGKALVIYPEEIQGIGRTEKKPEVLLSLYNQGVNVGNKRLAEMLKFVSDR